MLLPFILSIAENINYAMVIKALESLFFLLILKMKLSFLKKFTSTQSSVAPKSFQWRIMIIPLTIKAHQQYFTSNMNETKRYSTAGARVHMFIYFIGKGNAPHAPHQTFIEYSKYSKYSNPNFSKCIKHSFGTFNGCQVHQHSTLNTDWSEWNT